jgi:hypothetical protein
MRPIRLLIDYLAWEAGHVFFNDTIPSADVRSLWVSNGVAEYVKVIKDDSDGDTH